MFQSNEVIVLDTETTGLAFSNPNDFDSYGRDALCSISAILMRRNEEGIFSPVERRFALLNPQRPVQPNAARVNRFHSSDGPIPDGYIDLRGERRFFEIAPRIMDFIGDRTIVAHNAAFDLEVLDTELKDIGFPPLNGFYACTRQAFAELLGLGRYNRYAGGTRLDNLCDYYGISRESRSRGHGASEDSILCAKAFICLERDGYMREEKISSLPHRCEDVRLSPKRP
jgi:DNA polymerase-3 subunit epsilon